ncbi:MAG: cation diffusion facilitator family transporter [Candidatus Omnitrophica bacterium]|nr:cation diffusion facilitator family transporter [Candidatus Omnitrophota bacterium]
MFWRPWAYFLCFLLRMKDNNTPFEPEVYMLRATFVSLICNVVLVSIKATALFLVNSLAIAVDLGISLVGLSVSVILYYSIKLANRPADLFHNYGYGKVENVCEAMEGVVLIGIALAMSSQALTHLFHPRHIEMPWIGFASSMVNVSLNFGGAFYIFKMAEKSSSPAIHAEGVHYKLEGFISGVIGLSFLVSMFLSSRGMEGSARFVDPVAALLVSVMVIIPSVDLAKKSFFNLLDASVEESSQMEILKQLSKHLDRFCEFRDLRTRTSGRKKFVEFKLVVPEDISFREGHKTVRVLENDIKTHIPDSEVSIKMVPCEKDCSFSAKGLRCPYL